MGRRIGAKDWGDTPLGAPAGWPGALKTTLSTLLTCPQPMFAAWGPELLFFCNDAYGPIVGARLDSALGQPLRQVWSEIWDDIEPVVRQALDGVGSHHENTQFTVHRSGQARTTWWTFSCMPLRDEAGAIAGATVLIEETTRQVLLARQAAAEQRRQAFRIELGDALRDAAEPQALKDISAEKLGRYLQTGSVGYAQVDASGQWLQVDHEWRLDDSPSVLGNHWLDAYGTVLTSAVRMGRTVAVEDTANDPRVGEAARAAFQAIRAHAVVNVPLVRQGRLAMILFVIHPRPRAWTQEDKALIEEVAERTWTSLQRLQAELDLRHSNQALSQRTDELLRSENALRQSQKLEALGKLTGGVAHDFNNLLAIISASVELLRNERLPWSQRGPYLDRIFNTVGRAAKLTGQLLAFARQQPLHPEVFDVDEQVRGVLQLVRPLLGSQVQLVHQPCADAGCLAEADISQFETALVNLAVNARDAMEAGGQLTLAVSRADSAPAGPGQARRPGDFIAISVADTGCGIAPDKLEVIFEPFYTTKEVGKGTGLGLSQVFGFAKQSGGEVQAWSEPGQGSVFTLYLPRARQAPAPQAAPPQPEAQAGQEALGVLVVEDNELLGQMACDMLEALGHRPEWADNAASALEILAAGRSRFALVFSDVVMPGMNGIELGLLVRQRHPGLPVVLTSGYNAVMAEDGKHGFELIQKPYTLDAIVRVFRKVLGEAAQPPQPG